MDNLGGINLFTSHFIVGTLLPKNKEIECVKALHEWFNFKDTDRGMSKCNTDRTQFVDFLHVIELPDLKGILRDIVRNFKKSYPYAGKEDFLESVFGHTLWRLKWFTSNDYSYYGVPPNLNFAVYYLKEEGEFIDFAIPANLDIEHYKQYYKQVIHIINAIEFGDSDTSSEIKPSKTETRTEKIRADFGKHGFFELQKVKHLSESNKEKIIELISSNELPYRIAMFDFLGFITYLEREHFKTKYKLVKEISMWFDSDKEGRAVKGNISSLLKNTTENKDRYTAYKHKEKVQADYENLK